MYEIFCKEYPDIKMPYKEYKEILREHNRQVLEACLEGKTYRFGRGIGELSVARVPRKFEEVVLPDGTTKIKGLKVNFGATKKLKAAGKDKVVYFTDDWWYRWYWNKNQRSTGCKIPHKTVWKFSPTKGPNGITRKLSTIVKGDDFAHIRFALITNAKKSYDGI